MSSQASDVELCERSGVLLMNARVEVDCSVSSRPMYEDLCADIMLTLFISPLTEG
jgi:hypothetical protein